MSGHHKPLLSRQPCQTDPQLCQIDPSSPIKMSKRKWRSEIGLLEHSPELQPHALRRQGQGACRDDVRPDQGRPPTQAVQEGRRVLCLHGGRRYRLDSFIPLFTESESGPGITKRLKIQLQIWVQGSNHNTSNTGTNAEGDGYWGQKFVGKFVDKKGLNRIISIKRKVDQFFDREEC